MSDGPVRRRGGERASGPILRRADEEAAREAARASKRAEKAARAREAARAKAKPATGGPWAARDGGAIGTRTFIPHRCHKTIGVLGAVSVATACLTEGAVGYDLANKGEGDQRNLAVEHPTGEMTVVATLDGAGEVVSAAILRTARKLMDGEVFA